MQVKPTKMKSLLQACSKFAATESVCQNSVQDCPTAGTNLAHVGNRVLQLQIFIKYARKVQEK